MKTYQVPIHVNRMKNMSLEIYRAFKMKIGKRFIFHKQDVHCTATITQLVNLLQKHTLSTKKVPFPDQFLFNAGANSVIPCESNVQNRWILFLAPVKHHGRYQHLGWKRKPFPRQIVEMSVFRTKETSTKPLEFIQQLGEYKTRMHSKLQHKPQHRFRTILNANSQ